jgi:hypothetical protein
MVKATSAHLKTALLSYWRFKRQFNVADEVTVCYTSMDIAVDTGGFLFEIEVKTSKSDLIQGEKRKDKHKRYLNVDKEEHHAYQSKYIPNQYFLCVPTELVEVAKTWCEKTNPNYGVLEYRDKGNIYKWEDHIRVARRAKFLHEIPITTHKRHEMMQRMSSARAIGFQKMMRDYVDQGFEDYTI